MIFTHSSTTAADAPITHTARGAKKRHLLERVLGDGGSDEPDDQHGQDDRGDETSVLHNGTLA